MEDLAGGDGDESQDIDPQGQGEDDNQDALDEDDEQDEPDESPTRPQARRQPSHTQPNGIRGERRRESLLRHGSFVDDMPSTPYIPEPTRFVPTLRQEMVTAGEYDLVPTIAAPQGTSINAVTATPDMRWVFSGGTDGWVRKFNWVDTVNGKLPLTVAQRHPFVDTVQKAGILHGYWENEAKGKIKTLHRRSKMLINLRQRPHKRRRSHPNSDLFTCRPTSSALATGWLGIWCHQLLLCASRRRQTHHSTEESRLGSLGPLSFF